MKKQKKNKASDVRRDEELDLRGRRRAFRKKKSEYDIQADDTGVESSYLSKA